LRALLSNSTVAMLACLAVTACSGNQYDVSSNPSPITVTNVAQDAGDAGNVSSTPDLQSSGQFPLPTDRDLRVMTTKLSGGAVEIFDLDGAPGSTVSSVSSVQVPAGVPLASDPRVTVYPLDGGELSAGVYGGVSSYYPTEPNWPATSSASQSSVATNAAASRVYFDHGSARLKGSAQSVVRDAAEVAKFAPVDRVSVEGHASSRVQTNDPIKGRILNLKESMNRAFEVSKDLIEQGVPAEKIKTVGWGDTKQTGGTETEDRRVDIVTGQ
jgi:outer membrane protein OmpA-like peptidoglycan-associated protein